MILYFTGTGNSRYVAEALAERLSDETVSLNDVLKHGSERSFFSDMPFVIVTPIYAWRMPRIIEKLVSESEFKGTDKMYFVVTMGSETGKCDAYCKKIAESVGMSFMGLRGIAMPNNYISYSVMDSKDKNAAIIAAAIPQIDETARAITELRTIEKTDKTALSGFMSGAVNWGFYKFMVNDKGFAANDDCIACGQCEKLCPLNNIRLVDGRPVFGGSCTCCYACIQHCPKSAINIGNKTQKHGRYVCPEYKRQ